MILISNITFINAIPMHHIYFSHVNEINHLKIIVLANKNILLIISKIVCDVLPNVSLDIESKAGNTHYL